MPISLTKSDYPTCDNDCARRGWVERIAYGQLDSFHISFPEGTDLDSSFKAFDHDGQEMIQINGWLVERYEDPKA